MSVPNQPVSSPAPGPPAFGPIPDSAGPGPPTPDPPAPGAAGDTGGSGGIGLTVPIICGLVVGAGILAVIYKMSTAKSDPSPAVEAVPAEEPEAKKDRGPKNAENDRKVENDRKAENVKKVKVGGDGTVPTCEWPCPHSRKYATGPCRSKDCECEYED